MPKIDTTGMTPEQRQELAEKTAMNYFRQGLNCPECVAQTFMDMHDTDLPEKVMCLLTGFGGGMGATKNTCGAITGAVAALGMAKGRRDPFEREAIPDRIHQLHGEIYPDFRQMVTEIKDHYGTLICSELSAAYEDFEGKPRRLNCMRMIGYCAAIAEKYSE